MLLLCVIQPYDDKLHHTIHLLNDPILLNQDIMANAFPQNMIPIPSNLIASPPLTNSVPRNGPWSMGLNNLIPAQSYHSPTTSHYNLAGAPEWFDPWNEVLAIEGDLAACNSVKATPIGAELSRYLQESSTETMMKLAEIRFEAIRTSYLVTSPQTLTSFLSLAARRIEGTKSMGVKKSISQNKRDWLLRCGPQSTAKSQSPQIPTGQFMGNNSASNWKGV